MIEEGSLQKITQFQWNLLVESENIRLNSIDSEHKTLNAYNLLVSNGYLPDLSDIHIFNMGDYQIKFDKREIENLIELPLILVMRKLLGDKNGVIPDNLPKSGQDLLKILDDREGYKNTSMVDILLEQIINNFFIQGDINLNLSDLELANTVIYDFSYNIKDIVFNRSNLNKTEINIINFDNTNPDSQYIIIGEQEGARISQTFIINNHSSVALCLNKEQNDPCIKVDRVFYEKRNINETHIADIYKHPDEAAILGVDGNCFGFALATSILDIHQGTPINTLSVLDNIFSDTEKAKNLCSKIAFYQSIQPEFINDDCIGIDVSSVSSDNLLSILTPNNNDILGITVFDTFYHAHHIFTIQLFSVEGKIYYKIVNSQTGFFLSDNPTLVNKILSRWLLDCNLISYTSMNDIIEQNDLINNPYPLTANIGEPYCNKDTIESIKINIKFALDNAIDTGALYRTIKDPFLKVFYHHFFYTEQSESELKNEVDIDDINTAFSNIAVGDFNDKSKAKLEFLLERGANVDALNANGNSPLISALISALYSLEWKEMAGFLLGKGASGNTALIYVLTKYNENWLKQAEFLLENGVDIYYINQDGISLLDIIKQSIPDWNYPQEKIEFLCNYANNMHNEAEVSHQLLGTEVDVAGLSEDFYGNSL